MSRKKCETKNFWYPLMSTKSFLFRIFFYLSDHHQTLTKATTWNNKKTLGQQTFYLWQRKVIEFESWILTDFQLENGVKIHISNSINFCVVKTKVLLTTRFFCHSKLYFMLNFDGDRMGRKKMRNIKLLAPIGGKKKSIFQNFSMVPCFTRIMASSYKVFSVIGETSIFRPIWATPLV